MRFSSTSRGFTLVEVLIIAPIVILAVSGFVALMISMTADVLLTRDQNNMTYETQDALDLIEQDTRLSTQFLVTTKALPSPQGSNDNFTGTAAFTNANSTLIMGALATDKNPADPERQMVVYAGQPNPCGTLQAYNRPFLSKVVYFLKDGSLWRRVVLPDYNTSSTLNDSTVCSAPWQRNTCSPGYGGSTRCQTNDSEIMQNVDTFDIKYYDSPKSTTPLGSGNATNATTIGVTLSGKKTTVGREITSSGSLRATKLNNIDVEIPAPGTPDVTAQVSGSNVIFTWPKVPLASSYDISYNTNGGAWTDTTLNSQETSHTVPAGSGATVTIKVTARNSTGSSSSDTASATIPTWNDASFQTPATWSDYGVGYSTLDYTKTLGDVVVLKGMVKKSSAMTTNEVIFTLPVGYRPTHRLVFITSSYTGGVSGTARIDVAANGEVRFVSGNNTWISLDGIRFLSSSAGASWTSTALQNLWTDFGSDLSPHQTTVDNQGRVHIQGTVKPGTTTAGTTIFALPAAQSKSTQITFLPASAGNGLSYTEVDGNTDARTNPGTHLSIQAMFYPNSFAGWTNLTLLNSWTWINIANNATASYTKSADGIVTLKGLIKKATNDDGTTIAQLPAGYRPKERLLTSCVAFGAYCRVDIMPNGDIVDTQSASNGWLSLDNISFMAEQ
jgi:hypothetical protein